MDQPLVSIVICVLNDKKNIRQAIQSVLEQDYSNIELVVIDGGSTDGTLEIIKSYEDSIHYLCSEPDNGIYNAFNKGVRKSKGELIKILNSDDFFNGTHAISMAVEAYLASGRKECVLYSVLNVVDQLGQYLKTWTKNRFNFMPAFFHPTWFVTRDVYERYGLYDESFRIASDYEFYQRCLRNKVKMIFHDSTAFVNFRTDGASSSMKGIYETFAINKKYLGRIVALHYFVKHMAVKYLSRIKMVFLNTRLTFG